MEDASGLTAAPMLFPHGLKDQAVGAGLGRNCVMSDFNFSGILLTTEKDILTVAPGGTQELPVILKNNSASPEQVRIMVEGVPLPWISTERPVLLIQPGEEVSITLVIHPPEPPSANAGRYQMRIQVTSTLDPERYAETLVTLTVAGFEVPG